MCCGKKKKSGDIPPTFYEALISHSGPMITAGVSQRCGLRTLRVDRIVDSGGTIRLFKSEYDALKAIGAPIFHVN